MQEESSKVRLEESYKKKIQRPRRPTKRNIPTEKKPTKKFQINFWNRIEVPTRNKSKSRKYPSWNRIEVPTRNRFKMSKSNLKKFQSKSDRSNLQKSPRFETKKSLERNRTKQPTKENSQSQVEIE